MRSVPVPSALYDQLNKNFKDAYGRDIDDETDAWTAVLLTRAKQAYQTQSQQSPIIPHSQTAFIPQGAQSQPLPVAVLNSNQNRKPKPATPVQLNFRFPLTSHTPVFTYPMQDSIDTHGQLCVFGIFHCFYFKFFSWCVYIGSFCLY